MSIGKGDVVLVTGATGFTGQHLVRALCATGATVRAIVRETSRQDGIKDLPLEIFQGDVFSEDVGSRAAAGVHYIFHTAAAYREAKISDDVYWKVHVQSTRHLAQAALKNPGFKRFVHVSTIGVHGHIADPPANEEYRFAPGDQYQDTKVEAELWIREFAEKEGLALTVIRPAAIYGPGDRRLLKVFKMAKKPLVPILGYGCNGLYHLVHVQDLVQFMILSATHEKTAGEVYICGARDPISIEQMIRIIAKKLNTVPVILRLPVTPFFIAGDICEWICKPLGIEPPIYRRRVAFFTKDRAFDTSKMREHTEYENICTNESGLADTTDWYIKKGWL
ncbi:NAD-dependent epimerase/dehydratase family protein [Leisingera sp. XS_AS12]|uniref:NAD-dependent epimerase/dehydratase family protein n=1 Tax=Leisingera sp. XS_AS12 TaxID=3241294 RepID=UPI003516CF77